MPKFRVRICQERVWDVEVKAESPEEAEEAVSDALDAGYHPMNDDTNEQGVRCVLEDCSEDAHMLDDSAELVEEEPENV